ncbi:hypothetical protein OKE68_02785 [Riemerella anatipestifer]|uniref:Uncharacterized protein n=1 Tax=Riemerella anatipestifer TaxID=34085 RepID=A0AAP3AJW8_RIEAN|nr:hypothetical protein [Riemerella anatipestifer]MBT0572779.1 hypothetical protein [Riemerella anatipestifer]MCE3024545.1 hypothetical protein [Riemerella anatipestifer]MCU7568338.1 hypothetical protein [Riemerella anatipestifer]MCW0489332.1 hypothetical protein [Riemerella anatipestifer]MCW0523243.1 hypothetical protein [Riemerella anatipestifer]
MKKFLLLFSLLVVSSLFGSVAKQDSISNIITSISKDDNLYRGITNECELEIKETPKYISDENANIFYITDIKFCGGLYYITGFYMGTEYNWVYYKRNIMHKGEFIDIEKAQEILSSMSPKEYIEFVNNSKENSIIYIDIMKDRILEKLKSYEKYGIGILEAHATAEDYTTGAKFRILNTSKKTIKYITFNFYGENAVEDKVLYRKGSFSTYRKGIGPVESYDIATWSFDSVWLTDIVEYLTITSINIQYMDGTSKNIKFNSKMMLDEKYLDDFDTLVNISDAQNKE